MIIFPFRGEAKYLNKQTRADLPGKFIELPDGIVHYELSDSDSEQTIVLVHGFSVPYYIWDPTVTALSNVGMRVLRYDLYERGYSDRPITTYNIDLFDRQLFNLLNQLEIASPISLAGISMGGPIVAHFAVHHPERIHRLCLIDPAGFCSITSPGAKLLKAPVFGEILLDIFGKKVLVDGLTDDFYQPDLFPEYQQKYLDPMKYRGFKQALLSTMRQGIVEDKRALYQQLAILDIPTLIFWGKYDKTFPVTTVEIVKRTLPAAEIHIIDEAGHASHYEHPEIVNPILISFLLQN